MATALEALPDDPGTLKAMLIAERVRSERLEQIIKELQRYRFGRRAETLPEDQLLLGLEDVEQGVAVEEAEEESADPERKTERAAKRRTNRGSLPPHLPRIETVVDIEDKSCPCCQHGLHVIGEDVAERLDIVPAQFRVLVTRRPRYGCRACEGVVVQAPAPNRLIEGGIPTEATVAQVLVSKYADHLPLYRQAQIYARQGVRLDRSTLADWVGRAAFLLRPVHERLLGHLKASAKLFADETTAPVLDPGRGRTKTGQFFAYARDDRPFGGNDPPAVAYIYAPDRKAVRLAEHLQGFNGILQVDGYSGYKALAKKGPVRLAFCWAHYHERSFIWSSYPLGPSGGVIARARAPDKARDGGGFCRRLGGRRCRSRCGQYQASSRTLPNRSGGRPDCHTARCILEAAAPSLVTVAMNAQRRPAFELHAGIAPRAVKRSAFFRIS